MKAAVAILLTPLLESVQVSNCLNDRIGEIHSLLSSYGVRGQSALNSLQHWAPSPLRHSEIGVVGRPVPKQGYPSGQRGWDEVPVRSASQVRILSSAPLSNRPLDVSLGTYDIGGLALSSLQIMMT